MAFFPPVANCPHCGYHNSIPAIVTNEEMGYIEFEHNKICTLCGNSFCISVFVLSASTEELANRMYFGVSGFLKQFNQDNVIALDKKRRGMLI